MLYLLLFSKIFFLFILIFWRTMFKKISISSYQIIQRVNISALSRDLLYKYYCSIEYTWIYRLDLYSKLYFEKINSLSIFWYWIFDRTTIIIYFFNFQRYLLRYSIFWKLQLFLTNNISSIDRSISYKYYYKITDN